MRTDKITAEFDSPIINTTRFGRDERDLRKNQSNKAKRSILQIIAINLYLNK